MNDKYSDECRWWQRHKWSKWEEETYIITYDLYKKFKRHIIKRTCG